MRVGNINVPNQYWQMQGPTLEPNRVLHSVLFDTEGLVCTEGSR